MSSSTPHALLRGRSKTGSNRNAFSVYQTATRHPKTAAENSRPPSEKKRMHNIYIHMHDSPPDLTQQKLAFRHFFAAAKLILNLFSCANWRPWRKTTPFGQSHNSISYDSTNEYSKTNHSTNNDSTTDFIALKTMNAKRTFPAHVFYKSLFVVRRIRFGKVRNNYTSHTVFSPCHRDR